MADTAEVPPSVAEYCTGLLLPSVFGAVFIVARLYTRAFMTRNLGADDALIFAAWITSIALVINDLHYPSIRHYPMDGRPSPQYMIYSLKLAYVSRLVYQLCLVLTKLAIAVFYLRIFQDRTSRHLIYAMITFIVVTFIPVELAAAFSCSPVQSFWSITDRHCLPPNPSAFANAICNIVADLMMMAFVLPRIFKLKMALRQKISLLLILSLAFVVIAATLVRLTRTIQGFATVSPWKGFEIASWTEVEIAVGFFCACAPCIRPLVHKISPRFLASTLSSGTRPKSTAQGPSVLLSSMSGTRKSRGFELSGKSGTPFSRNGDSSAMTGGSGATRKGSDGSESDAGSEKEIYGGYGLSNGKAREGEIVKTVSVTVSDEIRGSREPEASHSDLTMENSTVRFEVV